MTDQGRWAACGAMFLTGDAGGPPLAPMSNAASVVDESLARFGLDARVLAERAAWLGLSRGGRRSCGGASRLLEAADGWMVLTLAREDDVAALPAVFEVGPDRFAGFGCGDEAPWSAVAAMVAARPVDEVIARTRLLGVPAGIVGEGSRPFRSVRCATGNPRVGAAPPATVLDLSALWAGPLATACLQRVGATVVKVEDGRRPDGARRGDQRFFDLLNAGKRSVQLDFASPAGLEQLHRLVQAADIVVTAARPPALHRLGLDPDAFLGGATDRVWVAITAHGWGDDRVGFGDDIAAAAGLVARHPDGAPRFAADAVADPLGGARAAAAAQQAWEQGGRWFIDASLGGAVADTLVDGNRSVAEASRTGRTAWTLDGQPVATPEARSPAGRAAPLGADTAAVLAGLP